MMSGDCDALSIPRSTPRGKKLPGSVSGPRRLSKSRSVSIGGPIPSDPLNRCCPRSSVPSLIPACHLSVSKPPKLTLRCRGRPIGDDGSEWREDGSRFVRGDGALKKLLLLLGRPAERGGTCRWSKCPRVPWCGSLGGTPLRGDAILGVKADSGCLRAGRSPRVNGRGGDLIDEKVQLPDMTMQRL